MSKTREGEVFVRDATRRKSVLLKLRLFNQVLASYPMAGDFSFVILTCFIAYRAIARPTRSEYLARIKIV